VDTKAEGLIIINPLSQISIHKAKAESWHWNKWI